ncbi:hypothetical protein, partial [Acinetobacter baumannii]|uniref:Gldg family protein n=1 Tax=Acinetobacter baumannii TaxID=470 RepID=UPI000B256F94
TGERYTLAARIQGPAKTAFPNGIEGREKGIQENQDDVSIAALENITLGSAGILEPLEGATTRFTPLMRSSEYAMPVDAERFATLDNPETLLLGFEPTGERYTLAARIQGPAKTAFPNGIEGREKGIQE